MATLKSLCCLLFLCTASSTALVIEEDTVSSCLTSTDNSIQVCVDQTTGFLSSFTPTNGGYTSKWMVNASTTLGDNAILSSSQPSVVSNSTAIVVTRNWTFLSSSSTAAIAPTGSGAQVIDTFSVADTSIHWHQDIIGIVESPWSVPIICNVAFGVEQSQSLKIWAPWDRGSSNGWNGKGQRWVDPLQPSDISPGGWWDGTYRLGNPRSGTDYIIAPLATVVSADPWGGGGGEGQGDVGVSIMLSPTDAPLDTWLYTHGTSTGGYTFERHHHRISSSRVVSLDADIIGHSSDWRSAMSWATTTWQDYFDPVNTDVFESCAGTGSYSYYIGNLTNPALYEMDYKVNWDLSGRYFPYMGMFLPPLTDGNAEWLNDPEGSQPRANVSFNSIGAWYREMVDAGFTDLSYFNVNEYGINIVLPPSSSAAEPLVTASSGTSSTTRNKVYSQRMASSSSSAAAENTGDNSEDAFIDSLIDKVLGRHHVTSSVSSSSSSSVISNGAGTCADSWTNASQCIIENMLDSVVTNAWDEIGGRVAKGAFYSWQNAIVVDPGVSSYHNFLLEQLVRHLVYEDAFGGVIIDRSDWQDLYNLDGDDGISFIPEAVNTSRNSDDETTAVVNTGISYSLKISYGDMIHDLRMTLDKVIQKKKMVMQEGRNEKEQEGELDSSFFSSNSKVTPFGDGIMLVNTVGNGRLDNFRYFDGSFSEGSAVNGVGILGARSPAILWTYDANECCSTPGNASMYFQTHLYMGVTPMLPFPGNDHSIDWDDTSVGLYSRYGNLFAAIANKVWALFPHIVSVVNSSETTYAKVNAFITAVNITSTTTATAESSRKSSASLQQVLILPIVRGDNETGVVTLNLTSIDRVWGGASAAETKRGSGGGGNSNNKRSWLHPLLYSKQQQKEQLHSTSSPSSSSTLLTSHSTASPTYIIEVLYPGINAQWATLTSMTQASFLLNVSLQEGTAMVRIRVQ